MFMWSARASDSSGVSGATSRRTRPRLSRSLVRSRGSSGSSSVSLSTSIAWMIVRALRADLIGGSPCLTLGVPQSRKGYMAADPTRARAEADAAAGLYARHYERVYGYCLYKLGSREEAEDAAQTAFLHALRGLRRGVVPVAEANWLITIAKNVCLAGYRTNGRRRRLEVLSDPQDLAEVPALDEEAGGTLVGLEAALARIPEQQRRAVPPRGWGGPPPPGDAG